MVFSGVSRCSNASYVVSLKETKALLRVKFSLPQARRMDKKRTPESSGELIAILSFFGGLNIDLLILMCIKLRVGKKYQKIQARNFLLFLTNKQTSRAYLGYN